jgi:hypothetical protein
MKNNKNKKKDKTQIDEIDFKDQMADLDAWLLVLSHLCISMDVKLHLEANIVSEIGGILFQYLETKKKLEGKLFTYYKHLQTAA